MRIRSSRLLILPLVVAAACKKDAPANQTTTTSVATPSASASVAATASAKPAWKDVDEDDRLASADVLPPGKPVSDDTLAMFDLPKAPAGLPAGTIWSSVEAEQDGHRHNILKANAKDMYADIEFYDCRSAQVRKFAGKPLKDLGAMAYCFVTLPETYKGYPSFKRDKGHTSTSFWSAMRVIRVGNMIVMTESFTREKEWLLAELDDSIKDLDLATIAKW